MSFMDGQGYMDSRVLALAGMVQALRQVRRIAETGEADSAVLATATDSVFRIDAASPEEVYGHADALKPGMQLLLDYFSGGGSEANAANVPATMKPATSGAKIDPTSTSMRVVL